MDLIYPLGTGSAWSDNELRYSLRSVERHLPHLGRVVIVGEHPPWLRNVTHLAVPDDRHSSKLANSAWKVRRAIEEGLVGNRFVLMNDDFLLLEDVTEIPPAHRGTIRANIARHTTRTGYYFTAMQRMNELMRQRGYVDALDYELHQPMVFDTLPALLVLIDMQAIFGAQGALFRSAYGNLAAIGGEPRADCKVFRRWTSPPRGPYCSTDNRVVLTHNFRAWVRERYPTPSRFEIT